MYPPPPFFFPPAENGFSESFEKLSTAQLTCSEGAFFQYMVMRNVQLTGLYQEEVQNKGGGGEEGDGTMLQTTLNYLCYTGMGKLRRNYIIYL